MPNIERLRELCKHLRNHPEQHDQSTWARRRPLPDIHSFERALDGNWLDRVFPSQMIALGDLTVPACGTALCAAGTAALMAGGQLMFQTGRSEVSVVTAPDGHLRSISEFAAEWLGLNELQSAMFFQGGNTINQLEAMVEVWEDDPDATGWEILP